MYTNGGPKNIIKKKGSFWGLLVVFEIRIDSRRYLIVVVDP